MSKYDPLGDFLKHRGLYFEEVTLTFEEIEALLGFNLPPSARRYRAWWANSGSPEQHSHAQTWLAAGWKVEAVDQVEEWVRLRRLT